MQESNSPGLTDSSVQDIVDFCTLRTCLKEELAAAVNYPNETSSTSEQTSILETKAKETPSLQAYTLNSPHKYASENKSKTQVNWLSL